MTAVKIQFTLLSAFCSPLVSTVSGGFLRRGRQPVSRRQRQNFRYDPLALVSAACTLRSGAHVLISFTR